MIGEDDLLVEVTVVDGDAAAGLMQRLSSEVGVEDIGFDLARQVVHIGIDKRPDDTLVEVLNVLESWLGAVGLPPTRVEIDDHRYVLGAAV